MAMINRNTLVLTDVSVVRDVATSAMGNGLNLANPATTRPFSTRRQSQPYPKTESATGLRHEHDAHDADCAPDRAGRPGCCAGVLASRSTASRAGRAVPMAWPLAIGGRRSSAAWRWGLVRSPRSATVGKVLLRCVLGARFQSWKRAAARPAGLKPAGGTRRASTWGA
jgi:hypothetical protein